MREGEGLRRERDDDEAASLAGFVRVPADKRALPRRALLSRRRRERLLRAQGDYSSSRGPFRPRVTNIYGALAGTWAITGWGRVVLVVA